MKILSNAKTRKALLDAKATKISIEPSFAIQE